MRTRHHQTESFVEEQKVRLKSAQRMVTEGEPLLTAAGEELNAAKARRKRIECGEDVPLPGKPPSFGALLKELDISPAKAIYMHDLAKSLSDDDIRPFVEWQLGRLDAVRRKRAELRAFLRSRQR